MPHYTEKDDIVCHKEGKPLYTLPDGVQTFFSTRAKVDTPLRLEFADKGYVKVDWEPDKVVKVATRAEYNRGGRRRGWLVRKAKKAGVTIEGGSK